MKKLSILALILVAAVPSLFAAEAHKPTDIDRARWTSLDIRSIATALEAYATDHKQYPEASGVDAVAPLVQGVYIISFPTNDAWGNAYRIESTAKGYRIISAGADGTFDESSWGTPAKDLPASADAVYENGKFVRAWSFK
jgi:type II secretory pathway pseudopilin PulG